jgi:hypothetical protein
MAAVRRLLSVTLMGIALAGWTTDSVAQSPTQPAAGDVAAARDLFREGAKAAKAGQWEEARVAYERSYLLRPSPLTRYSLAMAQKETGHVVEALENFRAFLRDPMDATTSQYRPQAEESILALEGKVAWAVVIVASAPSGVEVRIDGVALLPAALGIRRAIDPGHHKVEAKAEGYLPYSREFNVKSAATANIKIELRPMPAAGVTTAPAPSAPPGASPTSPPSIPVAPSDSGSALGTTLMVTGGTLFVGGVVVGLLGVTKAKGAETSDGSDASSARTLALVGDVVGGVGLVTAAIGAYFLFSSGSSEATGQPKTSTGARLTPWVGRSGGGLGIGGSF